MNKEKKRTVKTCKSRTFTNENPRSLSLLTPCPFYHICTLGCASVAASWQTRTKGQRSRGVLQKLEVFALLLWISIQENETVQNRKKVKGNRKREFRYSNYVLLREVCSLKTRWIWAREPAVFTAE
jgi:hypothetical protein